jgi:hypothetical protein
MNSVHLIGVVGSALTLGSATPALANGNCDPRPNQQTYYQQPYQQTYRPNYQPTYRRPYQARDWRRQGRWNRVRVNTYRPQYWY